MPSRQGLDGLSPFALTLEVILLPARSNLIYDFQESFKLKTLKTLVEPLWVLFKYTKLMIQNDHFR